MACNGTTLPFIQIAGYIRRQTITLDFRAVNITTVKSGVFTVCQSGVKRAEATLRAAVGVRAREGRAISTYHLHFLIKVSPATVRLPKCCHTISYCYF
jgi:hypothetical protein